MAQTKTIQLLRSSSVYTSAENARQLVGAMTGQDGEIRIARYNAAAQGEDEKIQSMLCIYHAAPQLPTGKPAGWTFIEDVSNNADSPAALRQLINNVITGAGLATGTGAFVVKDGDAIIGSSTSITDAVNDIADYIQGLNKTASAVDGKVVTTVTQTNGAVTETKANVKDLQLGGYSKNTSATGAIGSTDTVNTALSKLENNIAANDTARTVSSSDQSITVANSASGTDVIVNVDSTTIIKSTGGALKADLTMTALTAAEVTALSDSNVKEAYKLIYSTDANRNAIGNIIKIYKDSSLLSVALLHAQGSTKPTYSNGTWTDVDSQYQTEANLALCFAYQLADGSTSVEAVPVGNFLRESEFGDGLQVTSGVVTVKVGDGLEFGSEATGNKSVKVKIDSTSEKDSQSTPVDFLTVGANGVKVSGIKDEIDRKIAALDVTDSAVAGQYVSAVNETDGKVAMTRANVSEAVLNNYAKGTAPASLDIAATDTINQAFAKLEHKIADGVASLDADITSTNGTNVQVQVVETDGKITAVNVTDNSINTTDLNNKIATLDGTAIATAANGNVYTVLTGVTEADGIISKASEVTLAAVAKTGAAADVSITDSGNLLEATNVETALQEVAGKSNTALQSVSGSNAITVGTKTNNDQQISLKLDTSTGSDVAAGTVTDMLTITNNGLAVNDTWDCGVFD